MGGVPGSLVVMALQFKAPWRLWWLLLVPLIALIYLALAQRLSPRRRTRSRLDRVIPRDAAWKRHAAVAAALASLGALVLAYAIPMDYTEVPRDRATIVIAIDVSKSMIATDVTPSRIGAEKVAAKKFLAQLPPRFNVALVSFAATGQIKVPPTTDRDALSRAIDALQVAPSTAIGEGVYTSLKAVGEAPTDPAHPKDPAPAAIVLLSDGATNTGRDSLTAGAAAKREGVPVYTIAYGTPWGYVTENGQQLPVPVDHAELHALAAASGGKAFSAESASQLTSVYRTIASAVGTERVFVEVTERYAGIALVLAIIAGIGVVSLGARWP